MKMKNLKRFLVAGVSAAAVVALTSCSSSTRNTQTPYGTINKDNVIASSTVDGQTLTYTEGSYYDTLKRNGYSTFTNEFKKIIYADEYQALISLVYSSGYNDLSADEKLALSYTDTAITEETYTYLKDRFVKLIETQLASTLYATTSSDTYNGYTAEQIATYKTKFIESNAKNGYTIELAKLANCVKVDTKLKTISVDFTLMDRALIENNLLSYAENLFGEKALYKIAGEEFTETLTEDDDDSTKETNAYYYFNDDQYESVYEGSYKTYGTYHAVVIQFNTKREALLNIEKVMNQMGITEVNDENVDEFYVNLYKSYYSYRGDSISGINSDVFTFDVNEDLNELSDFTSSIQTLITSTLADDDKYLTEPRNIDNKYVMAYNVKTEFVYSNEASKDEQLEFSELEETLGASAYAELIDSFKRDIIETNGSTYASRALSFVLRDADIKIYDPVIEYTFNNNYGDYYELIHMDDFDDNLIATINGTNITVDSFYSTLAKASGASTVIKYFQLAYADLLVDEYVDSDTQSENSSTVQSAIDAFNNNSNSAYPKDMGLENYLLLAYGYRTQDEVVKYYYNASSALSSYLAAYISESWADNGEVSSYAKRILGYLLADGNSKYSDLFNIDLDHILINIDDDGDGSPDDPAIFLAKLSNEEKTKFENAVAALAQAIYKEAINEVYADNTMIERLQYIVKAFNRGDSLYSDEAKTWDDFKSYNFLLTAEELASSGDITESSVSNFVTPFADYVKEVYKLADKNSYEVDEDNGNFIVYNSESSENSGLLTTTDDASKITIDSLCSTVFGYHLLVINSYKGPDSLRYTTTDDTYGYQKDMNIIVSKGDDADDDADDTVVVLSSYNEDTTKANENQLFIYMVQSFVGSTSTLDSDISTLLSSLFKDSIAAYSSSNFQTVLLIDLLNITTSNTTLTSAIKVERDYYVNQVSTYDNDSNYYKWLNDKTTYDFTRQ